MKKRERGGGQLGGTNGVLEALFERGSPDGEGERAAARDDNCRAAAEQAKHGGA